MNLAMICMNAAKRWLRPLMAALLLCCAAGPALASITVTAVTVNGGATTTAAPGAWMTITVTVVLTTGSKWRATSFTTTPASSLSWCYFSPNINGNGTYTRSFSVEAPTTVGTFSLNTNAYTGSQCGGTASATKVLSNAIFTGSTALDHVRIVHDGSALTCSPEPITLKACANAACTTLYTGSVSVSLGAGAGTWSSNPVTFSGGSASVNLSNATAGSVTLAGTVTSPAAVNSSAVCYNGSTAGSCTMVFSNAACGLDAVETGKAPNTALFTKLAGGTVTLDVLALNSGAVNTGSTASIAATLVSATSAGCSTSALSPTVNFTMSGADAGRHTVTFTPSAAARDVRVRMVTGSLVGCSSDNFAIRPASFVLSATGAGADASGASASASPVLKAASTAFALSADSAVGYDGVPSINQNMVQSTSANAGDLAGGFSAASAATGTAQGSAFTYSEVGYFRFDQFGIYDDAFAAVDQAKSPADCFGDANLGSGTAPADPNVALADGRLGCYFGNPVTAYFGRFIPDHFVLSSGAIVNRSAITACSGSTFSYLGEALQPTLTLTAANGLGATTINYNGAFARLDPATELGMGVIDAPASGTRTPFTVCTATPAHPCFTPGTVSGSFIDGEAAAIAAPLTVFRGSAAVAPFASFSVGFAPVDADGVKLATYDLDTVNATAGAPNHALAASTILRYGRLNIDNAYGSELLNLTMKVAAQYWTGLAYATNPLDSCTVPAYTVFAPTDYLGGINVTNMPSSKLVPGPALVNGVGQLMLTKPGPTAPGSKGSVKLNSSLTYLPGSGRATFGVYKSGPVIYVRETY